MKAVPTFRSASFSASQFRTRLSIAVILLNLMVIGLAFQSLHQGLEQSRARAIVNTRNLAQLLDHDIAAIFDRIDLTLQALVDDLDDGQTSKPDSRRYQTILQQHFSRQPALHSLLIVDEHGTVLASNGPPNRRPGLLGDRDYFLRHRNSASAGLVISAPLQGRIGGEWIITLSRRITTRDGRFAGVAVASIRLTHLRELFASLNLGPGGAVTLRDTELGLITRHPAPSAPDVRTGSRAVSPQLAAAIRAAPKEGAYLAVTQIDGIERTNAYRRMEHYPYYVIVGLADEDYLLGWYREVTKTAVQVALFVLATLVMLGLLIHLWSLRERDLKHIASKELELRILLDTAPDAIIILDATGHISRANQRALSTFGYRYEDLIGRPVGNLLASEWSELNQPIQSVADVDLIALSAAGRRFPVSISMTPTETERGRMATLVIRDSSERREREDALRLASLVYQAVGEAIMVTDTTNRIVAINPAFTRLMGYAPEEAIGQPASVLSSGRHDHAFFRTMWESLDATGTWKGEILNRRRNGEIAADWLMINTIYDDSGQVQWRVGMYSSVTEQKRAEELLWRQASYDTLTDLPNRRLLLDRLQQDMNIADRAETEVALLLVDLDYFKEVNDTLGHLAGDQLLIEVAQRLKACIRETDTAARLGGDEFAVILGSITDRLHIEPIAQSIRSTLAAHYALKEGDARISASIGIALYPSDAQDAETLFQRADQALYLVKGTGRNGFSFYTGPSTEKRPADSPAVQL
ncbi:diguanylate cyclase domain-containing protein [Zoogloea sp.]|uniref:bifunctional diguanylate cyclase/phosphodiesterase n=1 Tax=Zoogloea sp. TaxID=49181 RepID=UPI0035B37E34